VRDWERTRRSDGRVWPAAPRPDTRIETPPGSVLLACVLGQPEHRRTRRRQERDRDEQRVLSGADKGGGTVADADGVEQDGADHEIGVVDMTRNTFDN
jgi:hypothetical protein